MAERNTDIERRPQRQLGRPMRPDVAHPFGVLERIAEEMDRVFDDFGLGGTRFSPRWGRSWLPAPSRAEQSLWAPAVEMYQRDHDVVVRVDLPGIKKDDVKVDVSDDAIMISGERRQEEKTEREGMYRTERSYGSFYRTIPLPEGAMTDQAKATFDGGVLEITMPAPPEQVSRGRRLEIQDHAMEAKSTTASSAKK